MVLQLKKKIGSVRAETKEGMRIENIHEGDVFEVACVEYEVSGLETTHHLLLRRIKNNAKINRME
jgi:hypothetical protein